MRLSVAAVLLLGILAAVATAHPAREGYKHLAGPPSEFASMRLPSPDSVPSVRFGAEYEMTFAESGGKYVATQKVAVEGTPALTVSLLGPTSEAMKVEVQAPALNGGAKVAVEALPQAGVEMTRSVGSFAIDGFSVPSASYVLAKAPAGEYEITVTAASKPAGLVLMVGEESRYGMYSHMSSFDLELDRAIGVTAQLLDADVSGREFGAGQPRPAALGNVIHAEMKVRLPDGSEFSVPMKDDGASGDMFANDGVFGAVVEVEHAGSYMMSPVISGVNHNGHAFERVAHHIVPVVYPESSLTGISQAAYGAEAEDIVSLMLHVDSEAAHSLELPSVKAYAEVWGTPVDGSAHDYLPVAWVQSIEPVQNADGHTFVQVDLNEQWLLKAGVRAPLQLRNVVLQDVNANTIVSRRDELFVIVPGGVEAFNHKLHSRLDYAQAAVEVTERMTKGPRPAKYATRPAAAEGKGKLLLVHGYCSGPVWPVDEFTNAVEFEDHTQSRSQDEFAQLIKAEGDKYPEGFSMIGHSQGGLAGLHLRAFYWSGMDLVGNGRVLQSVGSPYKGCSMAGSLANLGNVFGVGCGSNYDLSVEGAQVWYATIPKEAREQVYYYTTQFKPGFLADCVTASNLILYSPNDGTCEKKFATVDDGHDMGHTEGWCHVTDMKYPPQCTDAARNAEMDAAAAR